MTKYKSNCCHADLLYSVVDGKIATDCYKCEKRCNPCIPVTLTKRSSIEICQELAELQAKYDKALKFIKYIDGLNSPEYRECVHADDAKALLKELEG